jgi:hypothetical protein
MLLARCVDQWYHLCRARPVQVGQLGMSLSSSAAVTGNGGERLGKERYSKRVNMLACVV